MIKRYATQTGSHLPTNISGIYLCTYLVQHLGSCLCWWLDGQWPTREQRDGLVKISRHPKSVAYAHVVWRKVFAPNYIGHYSCIKCKFAKELFVPLSSSVPFRAGFVVWCCVHVLWFCGVWSELFDGVLNGEWVRVERELVSDVWVAKRVCDIATNTIHILCWPFWFDIWVFVCCVLNNDDDDDDGAA